MEFGVYVMLHLEYSAYLMPREGQPAAVRCCLIPENFLVAHICHYLSPHNNSFGTSI